MIRAFRDAALKALLVATAASASSLEARGEDLLLPPPSVSLDPLPTLPLPTVPLSPAPLPTAIPTLPLPSVSLDPVPTIVPSLSPVPSLPLPSVSLDPLPSAVPTLSPLPTLLPSISVLPAASVPQSPGASPPAGSPVAPGDGTPAITPGAGGTSNASDASATPAVALAALGPAVQVSPSGGGAAASDSLLSSLVVPALIAGVPGLLLLAVVLAQLMGGLAVLPAIRRTLGSIGIRRDRSEAEEA